MALAKCKLVGVERVFQNFQALAERVPEKANEIVNQALEEIKDLARAGAPVDSGDYRESIAVKTSEERNRTVGYVAPLRPNGRISPIGHLIEFGTVPHAVGKASRISVTVGEELITTRSGKLRWQAVKGAGAQAGGTHPGAAPKPHLFPAFEAVRSTLKDRITFAIQEAAPHA